MILGISGGFSIPVGETWIKMKIDITLNEKEIRQPRLYNVEDNIAKGIKLINVQLDKHIANQLNEIKKMVEDANA
jgi:hypothetical protein